MEILHEWLPGKAFAGGVPSAHWYLAAPNKIWTKYSRPGRWKSHPTDVFEPQTHPGTQPGNTLPSTSAILALAGSIQVCIIARRSSGV